MLFCTIYVQTHAKKTMQKENNIILINNNLSLYMLTLPILQFSPWMKEKNQDKKWYTFNLRTDSSLKPLSVILTSKYGSWL